MKSRLGGLAARLMEPARLPSVVKAILIARSGLASPHRPQGSADGKQVGAYARASAFVADPSADPSARDCINPLFDADWYRDRTGYRGSAVDALVHYLLLGERAGHQPNPWFDPDYFLRYNRPRRRRGSVLGTYWLDWRENPMPHPHFDGAWYVWHYQDVADRGGNPLAHFLTCGIHDAREPNAYFSARWYCAAYPRIESGDWGPAEHFTRSGAREMHDPGPCFDADEYARRYPDYRDSGLDPLGHYLTTGRRQGRCNGTAHLSLWDLAGGADRLTQGSDPDDPVLEALRLSFSRWRAGDRPVLAIITHDLGGGTERQVRRVAAQASASSHVVIIRPGDNQKSLLRVETPDTRNPDNGNHGFDISLDVKDGWGFAKLLDILGVDTVQLHHLYNHGALIRDGLARCEIPFDFYLHDYYVICPLITLTTPGYEYCGEPPPSTCDTCIAHRPAMGATDIRNWREAHEWVVLNARTVVVPSQDAAARLRRYFEVQPVVEYHEDYPLIATPLPRSKPVDHHHPLRVVMLGVLSPVKGQAKVFAAARTVATLGLPIMFHLIGHTEGEPVPDAACDFTVTGEYQEHELEQLLQQARPDMFLFASVAPETYAFTLTAAMRTGQPILATDLGAFAERLSGYPHAGLFPHSISGEKLAVHLYSFAGQHVAGGSPMQKQ